MLSIAEEMAVSETAFLSLNDMNLRWFTPHVEVQLCGHGTLAVAHVLQEKGIASVGESLSFQTLSGTLSVTVQEHHIEMEFPVASLLMEEMCRAELLSSLGIDAEQIVAYGCFGAKELIEVSSEVIVSNVMPNFTALQEINGRGVVITAESTSTEFDFISRYFAPWVGVNEDPVTGSAHCALAVYWEAKLQKKKLNGYQASARGGSVQMELLPNDRVKLMGAAVTTLKGMLYI